MKIIRKRLSPKEKAKHHLLAIIAGWAAIMHFVLFFRLGNANCDSDWIDYLLALSTLSGYIVMGLYHPRWSDYFMTFKEQDDNKTYS